MQISENEKSRQDPRFLLASLVTGYPDETFAEYVRALLEDSNLKIPEDVRTTLGEILTNADQLDEIRSEYIDTFDRGRSANPLYETEYGRDRALVKGFELGDLAGFYKAFGLNFDAEGVSREMLDHISVELEFYALLLLKQRALEEAGDAPGVEIVLDARRKFLKDHLGRFPSAIAERPGVAASGYFSQVFNWCRDLVSDECAYLGVEAIPANWIAGQSEAESMACGSLGCGTK